MTDDPNQSDRPISRRDLLRYGLYGAAGLTVGRWLTGALEAMPSLAAGSAAGAKAKAVIQIWMWGGPSHLDTFDPKPEAGKEFVGPYDSPIATNVDGIRICQMLPQLAQQADKYSIIRSMTHGINGHETASYAVQAGRSVGGRDVFPSAGAVVSLKKGYDAGYTGLLPPYIVLTEPQGRFSEAGFLGLRHKPFATGGDPGKDPFAVEGIITPGISDARQRSRRGLLQSLDTLGQSMADDPTVAFAEAGQREAYDMILGEAGKVFDLTQEDADLRKQYGRNSFGQSCLLARRLVQRGVPYVTINYKGWDTHKNHFPTMQRRLPQMDRAMAALLEDLARTGLLDSTIVWWTGEFGRTPRIQWEPPWNGGRGHHGQVFSALLAGGGFKGGQVIGASDATGEEVKDRPVYPWDLTASIYQQLGIDPDGALPHPLGKAVRVTPSAGDGVESGGRLKEIM
jgi:hypothetical protein